MNVSFEFRNTTVFITTEKKIVILFEALFRSPFPIKKIFQIGPI